MLEIAKREAMGTSLMCQLRPVICLIDFFSEFDSSLQCSCPFLSECGFCDCMFMVRFDLTLQHEPLGKVAALLLLRRVIDPGGLLVGSDRGFISNTLFGTGAYLILFRCSCRNLCVLLFWVTFVSVFSFKSISDEMVFIDPSCNTDQGV